MNRYSVKNAIFSSMTVNKVELLKTYPKGFEGETGDKGIAGSAGRLPSLNPKKNDVLRLSVSSQDGLEQLLEWYLG